MNKKDKAKKEITLEDLTTIIQGSLIELKTELKTDIKELRTDVAGLKTDVAELKIDVTGLKTDVAELKTDVAELKVTVNNIEANLNKKVDKIDHNTLEYRVEKLEEKFA